MTSNKKFVIRLYVAAFFIVLLSIGAYFFATNKNKPVFLKEVDRIMFDTKNKPPKFLLTLESKDYITEAKSKIVLDDANQKEQIAKFDTLKNIPLITKLPRCENKIALDVLQKEKTEKPLVFYAKDVDVPQNFYKVAVVIKSMGLSDMVTNKVFESINDNVSLSFSPYAKNLEEYVLEARKHGHETYMDLPIVPENYLLADSGPKSLSYMISNDENIKKIRSFLEGNCAIGGVVSTQGLINEKTKPIIAKVLEYIKSQGMLFIDATENSKISDIDTVGLAKNNADILIVSDYNRTSIRQKLAQAEEFAARNGSVVLVVEPKPVVLTELAAWTKSFSVPQKSYEDLQKNPIKRPFILVPLSSVVSE